MGSNRKFCKIVSITRGHDEVNTCEEGADQQCVVDSVNAASLYFQSLFEPWVEEDIL